MNESGAQGHWVKRVGESGGYAGVAAVVGLPPYSGGLIVEGARAAGTEAWLTPADFEGLGAEALDLVLSLRGVGLSRRRFVRRAEGMRSAWTLARALWPAEFQVGDAARQDFAGMAAVALWRRWLPERPCAEAVGWTLRAVDPLVEPEAPTPADLLEAYEAAWVVLAGLLPAARCELRRAQRWAAARVPIGEWLADLAVTFGAQPAGEDPDLPRRAADVLQAALARIVFDRETRVTLVDHLADMRRAESGAAPAAALAGAWAGRRRTQERRAWQAPAESAL